MAKNALIGNLNLAVVGLSEKAINLLVDMAHRYGSKRSHYWMEKTTEMVATGITPVVKAVDTATEQVTGTVDVDGSLTPEQALKACDRKEFVNQDVLSTMPRGKAGAIEIVFVKFGRYIKANSLVEELRQQGFALTDPFTLMAWNAVNREFADTHPNTTQWLDDAGKYCYAAFHRWYVKRHVLVRRGDDGWNDGWWFACVRISTVD